MNLPDGTHAWAERREGQTAWEAAEAFIEGRGERRAEVSGYREQLASLLGGSSAPMPAPEGLPRTCLADLVDACGSVVDVAGGIFDRSPPCWAPPAVPIDVDSRPDRACLAVGNAAQSPRHVFIFWAQGFHDVPWFVPHVVSSWRRRNPNWKVYLLSESDIGRVVEIDGGMITRFGDDLIAMSDVLRINLLRDHGGVWADATLLSLRSLDDWLTGVELGRDFGRSGFFAFERPRLGQFGRPAADEVLDNWFFYADPRDDRVRRALSAVVAAMEDYWRDRLVKDEYFWLFDVFIRVHRENPDFQLVWEATPRLGAADGPLVFHFTQTLTRTIGACDWDMLEDLDPPVMKVSYKLDARLINACTPHCVLQEAIYLAGRADHRLAMRNVETVDTAVGPASGKILARVEVDLPRGSVAAAFLLEGEPPLQAATNFFNGLGEIYIDFRQYFCPLANLLTADAARRRLARSSPVVARSTVTLPNGLSATAVMREGQTAWEAAEEFIADLGVMVGDLDVDAAELARRLEAGDLRPPVIVELPVDLPDGTKAWARMREGQTAWEAAGTFIAGLGDGYGYLGHNRAGLAERLEAGYPNPAVLSRVEFVLPDGVRKMVEMYEDQTPWEAALDFLQRQGTAHGHLWYKWAELARKLQGASRGSAVASVRVDLPDGTSSRAEMRGDQSAWDAAGVFLEGLVERFGDLGHNRRELARGLDAADARHVVARSRVLLPNGTRESAGRLLDRMREEHRDLGHLQEDLAARFEREGGCSAEAESAPSVSRLDGPRDAVKSTELEMVVVEMPDGTKAWAERRKGQSAWEAAAAFLAGLASEKCDGLGCEHTATHRVALANELVTGDSIRPVVAASRVRFDVPDSPSLWAYILEGQSPWDAAGAFLEGLAEIYGDGLEGNRTALADHLEDVRRLALVADRLARSSEAVAAAVFRARLRGEVSIAKGEEVASPAHRLWVVTLGEEDATPTVARLEVPVTVVTDAALPYLAQPDWPLHPAVLDGSIPAAHRRDYVRTYLMHHHGGLFVADDGAGLAEDPGGVGLLDALKADSTTWLLGRPLASRDEVECSPAVAAAAGVPCARVRDAWSILISAADMFAVRPGTPLTEAVLAAADARLDLLVDAIWWSWIPRCKLWGEVRTAPDRVELMTLRPGELHAGLVHPLQTAFPGRTALAAPPSAPVAPRESTRPWLTAAIVEPRAHPHLGHSLDNALTVLPYDVVIHAWLGPAAREVLSCADPAETATAPRCLAVVSGRLVVHALEVSDFPGSRGYTEFLQSPAFWDVLDADKVLIFQTDAALCAASPMVAEDFRHLDFVGSLALWVTGTPAGNGGLSLRDVARSRACLSRAPATRDDVPDEWPDRSDVSAGDLPDEDQFFQHCMVCTGGTVATAEEQALFGTQHVFAGRSFGAHKARGGLPPEALSRLLAHCPEHRGGDR